MTDNRYTNDFRGSLLLVLAALVWGSCLVAQKSGTEYIGAATFVGIRSLISGLVLLAVVGFMGRGDRAKADRTPGAGRREMLIAALCCGVFCFASMYIQQIGVEFTSVGKAGFITALYILIIPVMGMIWGRIPGLKIWISVAIAIIGLYLMCLSGGFGSVNKGDVLTFIGAILLSCHFYCIDYFVGKVDPIKLSCYQFLVTGIICMPIAFLTEDINPELILDCALPILYAGVCSGAMGYTFQMVGQQTVEPTRACLLMSTESMFSLLSGMVVLGEVLTGREYMGCGLMFIAIMLSQMPDRKHNKP
ncbi:MAG: DMT family transporter [Bacillota bacterium]|nr:DMT family transporter [Bacillota bacterium]